MTVNALQAAATAPVTGSSHQMLTTMGQKNKARPVEEFSRPGIQADQREEDSTTLLIQFHNQIIVYKSSTTLIGVFLRC